MIIASKGTVTKYISKKILLFVNFNVELKDSIISNTYLSIICTCTYLSMQLFYIHLSIYLVYIYLPSIYLSPENGVLASHIEILTQYQSDFVKKNVVNDNH